jgi:hypothetical protein
MTDQDPEVTQDTGQDQADTKGGFLKGTYKGQEVAWNEDEARNLAQKGLDYETKKARLEAERQAMLADKADYDRWKSWRDVLRNDPARAEAIARAYENPDAVLSGGGGESDDDGEPARRPSRNATAPPVEVVQLKNQVEQLQSQIQSLSSDTAKDKAATRLGRAADSFSFLSSNSDAKALALETAEGLIARDPDMSPEGAMSVAAEKVRKLLRGQDQKKLDGKGKGDEMRTVKTEEGTPVSAVEGKKKVHDPRMRRKTSLRGDVIKELTNGVFAKRFPNF